MGNPSDEFTRFVLDQLARVPALTSAPFFGGIGLKSGASFFGMIMDGALYFSTSPATRAEYEKHGSRCFSYAKQGKVQATKLFEVPAEVLVEGGGVDGMRAPEPGAPAAGEGHDGSAPVAGVDPALHDPVALHQIDEVRGTSVADAQPALQ